MPCVLSAFMVTCTNGSLTPEAKGLEILLCRNSVLYLRALQHVR